MMVSRTSPPIVLHVPTHSPLSASASIAVGHPLDDRSHRSTHTTTSQRTRRPTSSTIDPARPSSLHCPFPSTSTSTSTSTPLPLPLPPGPSAISRLRFPQYPLGFPQYPRKRSDLWYLCLRSKQYTVSPSYFFVDHADDQNVHRSTIYGRRSQRCRPPTSSTAGMVLCLGLPLLRAHPTVAQQEQ